MTHLNPDPVDEILFARSCGRTEAEGEVLGSDFVNNADDDLDQEDMLMLPQMQY
jgi:hypothetical protein